MRTCASPTCSSVAATGGFTLLEVLVVISIMAVLTGMVVLGFTGADRSQQDLGLAEGLQQRFELARQRALQRNKTWGVVIDPDGYRFAEYDVVNQLWVEQSQRPFETEADRRTHAAARSGRRRNPRRRLQAAGDEDTVPDILFFASGEATPFTLELINRANDARWLLECDGFATIAMTRDDA